MKILIVEDDKVARKLADSILTKNGYETILVGSVDEAINKIEMGNKISLIILDIDLPDEKGFSLQEFLKLKNLNTKIPVIMCSSAEDEDSVMQSIRLGAVGYLKKPTKFETLILMVEEIITQKFKTILIVDDEKMIRDLLRATLEREGFNTVTAESGIDALKILDSQHVDGVMSDIQMEGMSGVELLKTIRSKYNDLPVIMITGHSNKYSKTDMNLAGAAGYVTKPFKNLEILEAVQKILKKCPVS